jgi:membrane peptidoglycan carboxypeptidase
MTIAYADPNWVPPPKRGPFGQIKKPQPQMQQQQMGGGMGPSPGFMNKINQSFGGGRPADPNYIAMSNMMNQTEGGGIFGGMKNMFGGRQQDPYQRYQEYMQKQQQGAPPEQAEGQPPMQFPQLEERPMPQDNQMMRPLPQMGPMMQPMGGGNSWGQPMGGGHMQPQNPYGRMKSAMMQGKQQMQNRPMPQMQGGPFNRRPMPQQPQPPQGPGQAMRRPMGNKMGGIGPSMM